MRFFYLFIKNFQFEIEEIGREKGIYLNVEYVSIKEYERLSFKHGHLILDGEWRVALSQTWVGQMAERWPEKTYEKRIQIELSTAITSPSIGLELVATKKVQQVLMIKNRFFKKYGE